MSNFNCEKCGTLILDTEAGYVTECEHYPITIGDTMSNTELKPCPFCGETPEMSKHFREDMWWMIHRCKVIGPVSFDWSSEAERLIKKWNTRSQDRE